MLSLYMDQHIPFAITDGLRKRGVDVMTAHEDGTSKLDDESLLQRATDLRRVLFSQDEDLLIIAQDWQSRSREFFGVAYAHQLSISIGKAIIDLEMLTKVLDPNDVRNRVEYLPY